MTADDLTRLRAVAEAATPGPWEVFNPLGDADQFNDVLCVKNGKQVACECDTEDAEFIATFDPPTVAALIDRVERAERERDRLDGELSLARGTFELMRDELAALRASAASLASDPFDVLEVEFEEGVVSEVAVVRADELLSLLTEGADDGQ